MARKMHCALQEIGDDSPKVSEAVKDSISTVHPQENNFTSVEGHQEPSLSSTNSDSRFAILTFLDFEPDGKWRILAIPVQCLNHINLASSIDMDGLQLLFPPPLNTLKIDQCKGPRGSLPHYAYSAKSFAESNTTESNVRRRCQNKIASRASKLNELPRNSCSQSSSLACDKDLFPDSSAAVSSSDKFLSNSKEDKSLKKNSRKRTRKKVRQSKKQSSESGSTEQEILAEEYVCVSLTSDTCSSNDVDKEVGLMLYPTGPESSSSDYRLPNGCERNDMNDSINVMEAPKSCNSYIEEVEMSKAITPIVHQNSAGESIQDKGSDFAVIDTETKDIKRDELCCFDDIPDSLVLDSVSVGSNSDASTIAHDTGKQSGKASSRIASNSGDEYFLAQNAANGTHNNCEHNEGSRHGGQNCVSNDKRVQQKRSVTKSSSFNKFGGGGVLHGRTGKENSHSVWKKVKKNGSDESNGDLKKVNTTTSTEFDSTVKKDPSAIRKCNSVSVNGLSKSEDKKNSKNKSGRKSKGKMDLVSKKEHSGYSRKGSHLNRSMLNDNAKDSVQQNDTSQTSSQENSDTICPVDDGLETNKAEQATSELVHSAQLHLEESDPQESVSSNSIANTKSENTETQASSLTVRCESINQSDVAVEQSLVSYNNHLGEEVDRTEKEVSSADYNAQNHSSGSSTLWKWIPIGKKDTGLTNSESNSSSSPECFDAPSHSENLNLETSVEPKVPSVSQNQDSSLDASRTRTDQICSESSCLDKVGNQTVENQVAACTLTENKDKHEEANRVINECDNQHTLENDSYRIAQAVNDACRAQLACEAVHMATGGPIAEFERLLHFCSPVIGPSPSSPSCLTCSEDLSGCVALCKHEMPDLSLGCLWQWYEKHGSYGLEIRAQEGLGGGVGHFPFRAYFVPSLSAVQLFKNHKNQRVNGGSDRFPDFKVSEACEMVDISEHSSTTASQHSIFSVLFPQPRNQDTSIQTPTEETASIKNVSNPSINSASCDDPELLFEYFEFEQPQQRRPLYEKIEELVGGNIPIQSQIYGDPTILDSINLRDLHPRSWYSVAWYPIYRIPDGNFRAAFLTYHSLGHLVRRSTNSDLPTVGSCIISPAVGLQSYNAQGECWFQLKHSALTAETMGRNPSILLKERLRTLEETASLMARSAVNKGNLTCKNRHPDYEFFLSRRRY